MNKKFLSLFIVILFMASLVFAQVIGSYRTSTTSITLGKTTVTYTTTVPKDNDMLVVCPGIQIGMPRNMTSKQVSILSTRLQKIDFKKCIIMDMEIKEIVSNVIMTTKVFG